jgi:hypothetical protein
MVELVLYQVIFHFLLQLQPILYPAIFSLSLIRGVKATSRALKLAAAFKTI